METNLNIHGKSNNFREFYTNFTKCTKYLAREFKLYIDFDILTIYSRNSRATENHGIARKCPLSRHLILYGVLDDHQLLKMT